jgi:hypothetical protein
MVLINEISNNKSTKAAVKNAPKKRGRETDSLPLF